MQEVCGVGLAGVLVVTCCRCVSRQTGAVDMERWQEVPRILYAGDEAAALAVARSFGVDSPLQQGGDPVLLAYGPERQPGNVIASAP